MLNESNIPLEEDGIEEEILVDEEIAITKAMWGDIGGNIKNQTDLQNALDAKQDSLTEAQLNAVNSGITSGKVATYDGYADQIASKADQSALNAESIARGEADTALGTRIDNEALARQQADIGLQGQIDAITSKSDVVDVVATYADLQAYDTQHLGDNDVIKVLDDETHGDALTYYRWTKTNQTWTFIGQEAPYYSKSQTDTLLLAKQNTIDSSHKLSADLVDDSSTTNKFVTAQDKTNWNAKQDALTAGTGIDITDGVISTPAIVPEVVTELPTTGAEGKLYLTPKAHTTQTATGNPIEATITAQAGQLESFQLDGDTFQQSYTGKNLWPINSSIPAYNCTITPGDNALTIVATGSNSNIYPQFNLEANTQYTFSGEFKITNYVGASSIGAVIQGYDGSSWAVIKDNRSEVSDTNTYTFSVSFNTASYSMVRAGFATNVWNASVANTVVLFNPQLEKSATATTFEPYVGGQASPNPDYPQAIQAVTGEQTVEIVGKNLFDKNNMDIRNGYLYSTTFSYRTTNADKTFIVPCEPNTTYTISRSVKTSSFRAAYIDFEPSEIPADASSETSLTCAGYIANNGGTSITITTSATAKSLLVHYGNTNTDGVTLIGQSVATIMVEKSASATTYAPYSKQTLPISLGTIELCKLGTYQDYIYKDGESWKVHKDVGVVVYDGSDDENWSKDTIGTYTRMSIFESLSYDVGAIRSADSLCDHFRADTVNAYGIFFRNNRNTYFYPQDSISLISEWRTWLSSNNIIVYYPLKTATDTTITDTDLIAQLEAIRTAALENGANTITNTATGTNLAGDMEIGYFGFNPNNRYDKFIWLDLNNNYEQIGGE